MAEIFPSITVLTDEQTLTLDDENRVTVKISKAENNGIYMGDDNKLHLKRGNVSKDEADSVTYNTPGNSIEGTVGRQITKIKCTSYVTRLTKKPIDILMPILVEDIVAGILGQEYEDSEPEEPTEEETGEEGS